MDRNDPQPSTSGISTNHDDVSKARKRKSDDVIQLLGKENTYLASGFKRNVHGIIFQLKLLMIFVHHAIANGYPFRLATEMDAAEKLDDVVFEYKKKVVEKVERSLIFLQAKHKIDIDKNKIRIADLESTSFKNDFSLLKYFISFCKIQWNEQFQGANQLFYILTNTDFEFSVCEDQIDDQIDSNATENTDVKRTKTQPNDNHTKWKNFFDKQKVDNEFLFFDDEHFIAIERKFKIGSNEELSKMLKSNLLTCALESKEIENLCCAKLKLEATQFLFKFRELIRKANEAVEMIEKTDIHRHKGEVEGEAKKVMKLKAKFEKEFFGGSEKPSEGHQTKEKSIKMTNNFASLKEKIEMKSIEYRIFLDRLKNSFDDLSRTKQAQEDLEKHKLKFSKDSREFIKDSNEKLRKVQSILKDFGYPNSYHSVELEKEKQELSERQEDLKQDKIDTLASDTVQSIKEKVEKLILEGKLPNSFLNGLAGEQMNLDGMKEYLGNRLDTGIADMSVIQVALDDDSYKTYLNGFLKQFRFITKYPKEKHLGELIADELGESYSFLNADFIYATFEDEMLKFMKEYFRGRAKYLETDEAQNFFEEFLNKTNTLMTSGLSKGYPDKLRDYGIRFKNNFEQLYTFLSNEDRIFHITAQSTRLTAIKVLQTLTAPVRPLNDGAHEQIEKYRNSDSFLFLRLRTLLRGETQDAILKAFKSTKTHDLMVIECQSKDPNENKKKLFQEIRELKGILEKNTSKKLIVIACSSKPKSYAKFKSLQQNDDSSSFGDLDEWSQKKLLGKEVEFQSRPSMLKQIMGTDFAAQVFSSGERLAKLLDENIRIGNAKAFSSLGYVEAYYIHRHFLYQKIKSEVLRENANFFITGKRLEDWEWLKRDFKDSIQIWQRGQQFDSRNIIISHENIDSFESLSAEFSQEKKSIHLLEMTSEGLFWKDSIGDVSSIQKFVSKSTVLKFVDTPFDPDISELKKLTKKIVLIANDSGMGKSTVLTSVARRMKRLDEDEDEDDCDDECSFYDAWIVRVNLNDYANEETLKDVLSLGSITLENAVDFFAEITVFNDGNTDPIIIDLQKLIFKNALTGGYSKLKMPKIILQVDGFDEIPSRFEQIFSDVLKAIAGSRVAQMWVTTRLNKKKHLESTLNSPAYLLNPWENKDQIEFLYKFWKWSLQYGKEPYSDKVYAKSYQEIIKNLKELSHTFLSQQIAHILKSFPENSNPDQINDSGEDEKNSLEELRKAINELDFDDYIFSLIDHWEKSVNKDQNFMNVALHLKMLTEVLVEKKFPSPESMDLFDLYHEFFTIKFKVYYKEKGDITNTNAVRETSGDVLSNTLSRVHCELAVRISFGRESQNVKLPGMDSLKIFQKDLNENKALPKKRALEELLRVGLLTPNREFIHRSFAEYFMSKYLIDNLTDPEVQGILFKKILVQDEYDVICKFFDNHLKKELKDLDLTEKIRLEMLKLIEDDLNKNSHEKTLLHVMAEKCYSGILKFLLKNIECNNQLLEQLMTKQYRETPIMNFFYNNNSMNEVNKTFEILLKYSRNLHKETLKNQILKSKRQARSILKEAASKKCKTATSIVLKFIQENRNKLGEQFITEFVLHTGFDGETALHTAVEGGPENVKLLLNWVLKELGNTTFEELILKSGCVSYNIFSPLKHKYITAFYKAADQCKVEVVEAILEIIENYSKGKEILRKLILETDNSGKTILNTIIGDSENNWGKMRERRCQIIKLLLECIDTNDLEDLALISVYGDARRENPTGIVYKLLRYTASIGSTNSQRIEAILCTIRDQIDKVQTTAKDLYDQVLSSEMNNDRVNTILYQFKSQFPESTSKIHVKALALASIPGGNEGRTVLHYAAEYNRKEIAEIVLDSVKDFSRILEELALKVTAFQKETSLHLASKYGHHETVSTILNFLKGKPEILRKLLFKGKYHNSAISLAIYHLGSSFIEQEEMRNFRKTIKVILEFASDNIPDICGKLLGEFGGMRKALKWAEENNCIDLKRHIETEANSERQIIELFQAAKNDENIVDLLEKLDDQNVEKYLLMGNKNGHTLLDEHVNNYMHMRNKHPLDCTFLDWMTNYFKDDPVFLRKIVLSSNENTVGNTVFLTWVKENLEPKHPRILKNLLMKTYYQGKSALSYALWHSNLGKSRAILQWMKDNCDEETLSDILLATDYFGENILHSATSESNRNNGGKIIVYLLDSLKNHSNIITKLILKPGIRGKTALDKVESTEGFTRLKEVYDKTASSLLDPDTDLSIFDYENFIVLKRYVSESKDLDDKEKLLEKIRAEMSRIEILADNSLKIENLPGFDM